MLQSVIVNVGSALAKEPQGTRFRKACDSRAIDRCADESQVLELWQFPEVNQTSVIDVRMIEAQCLQ